jgi:hypothetical protein
MLVPWRCRLQAQCSCHGERCAKPFIQRAILKTPEWLRGKNCNPVVKRNFLAAKFEAGLPDASYSG